MIKKEFRDKLIYLENEDSFNKTYFDIKDKKFIHNLDNIYYSVKVKNSWKYDSNCRNLIDYLKFKKDIAIKEDYIVLDDLSTDLIMNGIGFSIYQYDIEKKHKYIIFFANSCPNDDTPEIIVQIRAEYLWLEGEHKALRSSYFDLKEILSKWEIEIDFITENRLDYAYHTNYIQDPINFFDIKKLSKMQVSHFNRWRSEGDLTKNYVTMDYLGLGNRKSNNIYLRIYNKTQEVIRQGYKAFFMKIWLLNGMISRFDYYCYEECFLRSNYDYIDRARLKFYYDYGKDESIKSHIKDILDCNIEVDLKDIKYLADKLTPRVTQILNIEFQTKRKFYYHMRNSIDKLISFTECEDPLTRIFKIIDNKNLFHEYLTTYVIRFVDYKHDVRNKDKNTASWWKLLQNCKLYRDNIKKKDHELVRIYSSNINKDLLKKRVLNSLSTLSLYDGKNYNNVFTDIVDFASTINESDIEKCIDYKRKKMPVLSGIIKNNNVKDYDICIVNRTTGEIIK